jgi:probable rRNA maturation factor
VSERAKVVFSGKDSLSSPWQSALERVGCAVLREHDRSGTVSVVLAGDDEMRELNRRFLGRDETTDVLAFPLQEDESEGPPGDDLLGEVVISVDVARREAAERGVPVEREIALYVVHGILHLAGYEDREEAARRRMRDAEARYLDQL